MEKDSGVSTVLSEVLMITLVLILVPIVTISLMNQLPEDRVPTVTIMMSPIHDGSVTLYHKGGDWIRADSIKITQNGKQIDFTCDGQIFDLGNSLTTENVIQIGDKISLVTKNAVIFYEVAQA